MSVSVCVCVSVSVRVCVCFHLYIYFFIIAGWIPCSGMVQGTRYNTKTFMPVQLKQVPNIL